MVDGGRPEWSSPASRTRSTSRAFALVITPRVRRNEESMKASLAKLEVSMKRLFSVLCVLALTVVIAHAADNTIVGVTNVGPGTIDVTTDTGETRSVTTE